MEISERQLRQLARDVDEQHRDGMATMATDIAELHAETRRFRATQAAVQPSTSTPRGDPAAQRRHRRRRADDRHDRAHAAVDAAGAAAAAAELTDADIAAFAECVELAAVDAYKAAAQSGKLPAGRAAGRHHLRRPPPRARHRVRRRRVGVDRRSRTRSCSASSAPQIQAAADQNAILDIAYDLENAAAATYLFALGALTSNAALPLTASILPVESQHAVVLGTVLGKSPTDKTFLPSFQTQDGAVTPDQFPVA